MAAIVYDAGALLAAERRNPDFLALHDEVTAARIRPLVPVVVLAQAWRGGPQHQVSRVLKGCDIIPDDERTGRAAGIACTAAGTSDVVDAIVIATAVRHQAPIVTSDPRDLARIADAIGVTIKLYPT
jgi:predicted nucleic acid-binding protein